MVRVRDWNRSWHAVPLAVLAMATLIAVADSTSTSPDSRLTRWRIAVSPKPSVSDGVNPTPSSLMSATTTSPDSARNGDPVCDGWW